MKVLLTEKAHLYGVIHEAGKKVTIQHVKDFSERYMVALDKSGQPLDEEDQERVAGAALAARESVKAKRDAIVEAAKEKRKRDKEAFRKKALDGEFKLPAAFASDAEVKKADEQLDAQINPPAPEPEKGFEDVLDDQGGQGAGGVANL